MTEQELRAYIEAIRPADETAMDAARRRQAQLAKPPGSLGQLEELSIRLAGVTGQVCPAMDKCRVAVFAADNGVVAEGVSCTPPSVTLQQAVNMTFRKTGMSAMAAAFGDDVAVVDVGIDGDVPPVGILDRKVRRGTGNIVREDAMTRRQVLEAMAAGLPVAATEASAALVADCGLTAPYGDVSAFSDVLKRLLEDDTLRETLGNRAAQRRFDRNETCRRTAELYQRSLKHGTEEEKMEHR